MCSSRFSSPILPSAGRLRPQNPDSLAHERIHLLHSLPLLLRFPVKFRNRAITMRDRSKNRKPLQRGRISNEAIQAVQALKRAKNEPTKLDGVFAAKVGRLVKSDVVAALRELQNQGEGILALKVFECIRSEHWYKPQASIYADMVGLLASSQLFDEVELLISYLKKENLRPDTEGFNALLKALIDFKFFYLAMECFHLMKVVGCELEESTFKILLNGFELHGQQDLCDIVTEEAQNYFGGSLEFLEEDEQATSRE